MENLEWGLQMTVLGMVLVFALLALLWGVLTLVLSLDKQSQAPLAAPLPDSRQAVSDDHRVEAPLAGSGQVSAMPADLVAAIMIATLQHRSTLRCQAAPMMRSDWPDSKLFASRWVTAGRARQNTIWQPRGK